MGQYCGGETVLSFGDPRGEFQALRSGCAVYDLNWRASFKISGKDRTRWLNGMITNNIRDLPVGSGNYNFLLTPQGRIVGDLYVYNRGGYFLGFSDRSQLEILMKTLQRYIIMDQVELTDASSEIASIGVQGPRSREVLAATGFSSAPEPMQVIDVDWRGSAVSLTRMGDARFEIYQLWISPDQAAVLWDALAAAGASPVGAEALEMFRVAAGVPRYGQDIGERELPQETGQHQALNFSKGCYIGQEIVERIRSRGNVHRTLAGFVIEGDVPPRGAKIVADGKETGEITSALAVPSASEADGAERVLALGFIRRESAKPGTAVQVNGTAAVVSMLPFAEAM